MSSLGNDLPFLSLSIAESNLDSFLFDESSCCVALRELYSSNEIITTPTSFPLFIIRVSEFVVTLSRYCFISFLKSESVVVSMITFFMYVNMYKYMYEY